MSVPRYNRLLHRTAFATTCVALLPIAVGALVTTMGAGMAFRDWPTSDGQNMFAYPWLADFVRGAKNKFVEHGHRLAGMLIGFTSILLVAVAWWKEKRTWVRWLATGVLGCVIVQGLIGGGRVLANRPDLAMIHGNFAAIVFCLMATLTLVTSKRWLNHQASGERQSIEASDRPTPSAGLHPPLALKILAVLAPLAVYGQYILGGRQRHLHDMLYEHVAGAIFAAVFVFAFAIVAWLSRNRWFRRPAYGLVFLLVCQVGLGLGAWVTKFGWASKGYVAVQGSPLQLLVRSSHTVVGMLLLMTCIILALRILRVASTHRTHLVAETSSLGKGRLSMEGGAG